MSRPEENGQRARSVCRERMWAPLWRGAIEWLAMAAAFAVFLLVALAARGEAIELVNVRYDTREVYLGVSTGLTAKCRKKTGAAVNIRQSYGGSGALEGRVTDGLKADVSPLALASDILAVPERTALLARDWQQRFSPMSTNVSVVQNGNPTGRHDER